MGASSEAVGRPPRGPPAPSSNAAKTNTRAANPSWRKLKMGLAERPSTVSLCLIVLATLGLASSCFSEVQLARESSGYMQRMLSAMVSNSRQPSSQGLIKRHAIQFPKILQAPPERDSRAEKTLRDGRRMSLAAEGFSGLEGVDSGTIGITLVNRTHVNLLLNDFPSIVNNSSQDDSLSIVQMEVNSTTRVNAAIATEGRGTQVSLTSMGNDPNPDYHPSIVDMGGNSTSVETGVSATATATGGNLTDTGIAGSLTSIKTTANSTASIADQPAKKSKNPMPHPEFWPGAYYKGRSNASCDLGDGEWVLGSERLPMSDCPFASQRNERCAWRFAYEPTYRDYSWRPRGCELPAFDAGSFLRQWSNKTIIIAGDSLGRNFYGSFMCKLAAGGSLEYKDAETKAAGFQIFRNEEHNITFGRAMSEFLVLKETSREAFSRLNQTAGKNRFILQIDKVDPLWAKMLPRADLLILNSGHWWMGGGKEKLFILDGKYRPDISWTRAFLIGMKHVRKAVERSAFKGVPIFRTFSPSHYTKGDWNSNGTCDGREPMRQLSLDTYVRNFLDMTRAVFDNSTFQVMEISRLTAYRSDGHVGPIASAGATRGIKADCTHWCAEGVTDAWVDVLQAMLRTET